MSKLIKSIVCGVSCLVLASCANLNTEQRQASSVKRDTIELNSRALLAVLDRFDEAQEAAVQLQDDSLLNEYKLPGLSDSLLDRSKTLLGTPYRYGGSSRKTGFDCSGFVSYVYKEELGIKLPRTTGELLKMDAPVIARSDLEPGDLILFNDRGRGRVTHVGIYMGDDEFIHSSSKRSGGVRVDKLSNRYWNASYLQAKRVLSAEEAKEPEKQAQLLSKIVQ
ncbi:C40 family peptidase [Denitrificimonas caeni]|uniref:C40 family peptidase n=1 Tax=Denitrificimonas caeni TaxID=521720 RepID=A0AAF0AI95_9GAMM|nr:C40 family peptidase [Denitrificimonas caeni]NLJ11574.1 C40 family peptidase [Gammaproteobacteria bacterium]WBE24235.1 C40 family peptidase [Denitrificimonas caeni]